MTGMLCLAMSLGLCTSLGLSWERSTAGTLFLCMWAVSLLPCPTWKAAGFVEDLKEAPPALRRAGNSAASAALQSSGDEVVNEAMHEVVNEVVNEAVNEVVNKVVNESGYG